MNFIVLNIFFLPFPIYSNHNSQNATTHNQQKTLWIYNIRRLYQLNPFLEFSIQRIIKSVSRLYLPTGSSVFSSDAFCNRITLHKENMVDTSKFNHNCFINTSIHNT